jgi:dimethylamine monooxygenase subunit A
LTDYDHTVNFDFSHISVPFRMQPGLHRLENHESLLTPLAGESALHASKARVLDQALQIESGVDTLSLRQQFLSSIPACPALSELDPNDPRFWQELALRVEEDIVVLSGEDMRARLLMVCSPSGWAPECVLGKSFENIHTPVADNERLLSAAKGLVKTMLSGAWQRWVWTLSPSDEFDRHPTRCGERQWPVSIGAENFAEQAWLRVEHQKLIPLISAQSSDQQHQGIVFLIRILLSPVGAAVQTREQAIRLHDSLQSMSDAVLEYKNLMPVRAGALEWLRQRITQL